MVGLGLGCLAAAVVCSWVFVGTTARADVRGGGTSRISRRAGGWLLAALLLSAVGFGLIGSHVVGLWL